MSVINRDSQTTNAPKRKRRNIRTLPANRMEYLLDNYRHGHVTIEQMDIDSNQLVTFWHERAVLAAMQAAYNAGKRDGNKGAVSNG